MSAFLRFLRYGLEFSAVRPLDLEMVRRWRNAEHVQSNMEYTRRINKDAQRAWYNGLDPETDLYFLVLRDREPLGVVNLKSIDWQERHAEAGVFMKETAQGSPENVTAVLAVMDLAFWGFGLQALFAKMRLDRPAILKFNAMLGYERLHPKDRDVFQYFETNRKRYLENAGKLRAFQQKLHGGETEILDIDAFWREMLQEHAETELQLRFRVGKR